MTRVSSRTLRHYDHVGLLPPARASDGGLRFHERPQLERRAIKDEGDACTASIDAAAGLAAYLRDAIAVYARERLR